MPSTTPRSGTTLVFAFVVAGVVVAMPTIAAQWAATYRRLLPWLLGWSFVAMQLDKRLGGPYVPDSPLISLLSRGVPATPR